MSGREGETMGNVIDDAEIQRRGAEHGLTSRIALADELRSLLEAVACSVAEDAMIEGLATRIREATDMLGSGPSKRGYIRSVEGALTGHGKLSELGPFTGRLHAIAPRFRLILMGERAEAFATYGYAHQGPPGLVHGGFIAATFDELLGVVQGGSLRVTADLEISYRAPAPLHRELHFTTWLEQVAGRKASVTGTLHDGDRLCAEARAVFVQPRRLAS